MQDKAIYDCQRSAVSEIMDICCLSKQKIAGNCLSGEGDLPLPSTGLRCFLHCFASQRHTTRLFGVYFSSSPTARSMRLLLVLISKVTMIKEHKVLILVFRWLLNDMIYRCYFQFLEKCTQASICSEQLFSYMFYMKMGLSYRFSFKLKHLI